MLGSIPIIPKNSDGFARIISVGRLSKPKDTQAETQLSLDAIRSENERLLSSVYSGPKIIHYLGEQISGLLAERQTMTELWEMVASGEWDVIIAEDLGRVFRNPRFQLAFLQDAVDADIRVICFSDGIDTADENWEAIAAFAAARHGLTIPDARRRIRRTATESFHQGGMVLRVRFGYAKVSRDDAEAGKFGPKGLRMRKLSDFEWVFDQFRHRFAEGQSPMFVVDWLNADAVPVGPYVKSKLWTKKVANNPSRFARKTLDD